MELHSDLFPIGQAAAATGLSRATILRLEERGLLKPVHITSSGRRYYDDHNISRILEVQRLQAMGFSTEDVRQYFASSGDAEAMFALVEKRMQALRSIYDEMKLRARGEETRSVQLIRLQESTYYTERWTPEIAQDPYPAISMAYQHCIRKGYVLSPGPLTIVAERTDYLEGRLSDHPATLCPLIPIRPGQNGPDAVRIPACTAVMLLYSGNYDKLDEAYLYLGEQVRKYALTPTGYLRTVAVVSPYTDKNLAPDKYRAKLILPIEEPPADCGLEAEY